MTPEERARLREACDAARAGRPGATLALAEAFSVDVILALLDERDALESELRGVLATSRIALAVEAAEVERLRGVVARGAYRMATTVEVDL